MELITIAKPYANAIFEIAAKDNTHSDWKALLTAGSQLVEDTQMQLFIAAPNVNKTDKLHAIKGLLESILGRNLSPHENAFLEVLLDNGRTNVLPSMLTLFESLVNAFDDTKKFTLISAYALSHQEEEKMVKALEKQHKTTVNIDTQVDKNLIGGIVVREDDKVTDRSIQARVNALSLCLS